MEQLGGDFDFGNVPMCIVTDYDAMLAKEKHLNKPVTTSDSTSSITSNRQSVSTTAASISSAATSSLNQAQQWSTGFADVADAIWNRMTGSMRQKLQEACVEVLRRTDDPSDEEKVAWMYDEDARFLD
ncbi:hypothetical protein LTR17_014141 [Elasticomyces elasticus]|nr:hypothetical protein LTR17_014141 [Elasticomyces elasticus]